MHERIAAAKPLARINGAGWRRLIGIQELGILAIFLLWCTFLSLTTTTFLTPTNVFNMLRAFWIAIAALGECLVILTAGIDSSVSSNMALSAWARRCC